MTLTSLLGCALPIIQAPMAGVQDHRLALAVCRAGGLGSLPAAMLTPAALRTALTELQGATSAPFNVNFFCHREVTPDAAHLARWRHALAPGYERLGIPQSCIVPGPSRQPFGPEQAALIEALRPAVVSFHFGLPAPELLARVKGTGAKVLASATTVAEARWLEAHGADVIIAQGLEAGGHRGHFLAEDLTLQAGLFALLPQIVDAVRLPVVAAGGIMDARAVRAARSLGAAGVQVGTAFLLCDEATTSPLHRAALLDPARHSAITNLFTGRPARGLHNRLMGWLGPLSPLAPPFPHASAALAPLRSVAEAAGRDDFTPLWAGQGHSACRAVAAAEVVALLAAGWDV
ncbi:NAD(P)H-dependent flavin oxidoreductase [Aeromonas simiae]|uniref:NAD(P)H-dependent flavin oxidoreductase n=1 Tax=Aeromonas simiae TaxID=218936 RepID=UPI0005A9FA9C|nr:nitronate monooxygenase [Aeromonas simiae]